jgi:hypothetical protein
MIENFVPLGIPIDLVIDAKAYVLIGWVDADGGLSPVVVDPSRPCKPTALVGELRYGWPSLPVNLAEDTEVKVYGAGPRDGSAFYVRQVD